MFSTTVVDDMWKVYTETYHNRAPVKLFTATVVTYLLCLNYWCSSPFLVLSLICISPKPSIGSRRTLSETPFPNFILANIREKKSNKHGRINFIGSMLIKELKFYLYVSEPLRWTRKSFFYSFKVHHSYKA